MASPARIHGASEDVLSEEEEPEIDEDDEDPSAMIRTIVSSNNEVVSKLQQAIDSIQAQNQKLMQGSIFNLTKAQQTKLNRNCNTNIKQFTRSFLLQTVTDLKYDLPAYRPRIPLVRYEEGTRSYSIRSFQVYSSLFDHSIHILHVFNCILIRPFLFYTVCFLVVVIQVGGSRANQVIKQILTDAINRETPEQIFRSAV